MAFAIIGREGLDKTYTGLSSKEEAYSIIKREKLNQIQRQDVIEYSDEADLDAQLARMNPIRPTPDVGRPISSSQAVENPQRPGTFIARRDLPILEEKGLAVSYRITGQPAPVLAMETEAILTPLPGFENEPRPGRASPSPITGSAIVVPDVSEPVPGIRDRIIGKFDQRSDEFKVAGEYIRTQEQAGNSMPVEKILAGVGYFGLRATKGIVTPILYPVQTAKGLLNMIIHPIQTGKELGRQLAEEPVGTIAELTGQALLFKGVTKGVKAVLPKAAVPPVKLKFATAAEIKSVKTPQGTVVSVNPIDFAARVNNLKVVGTGTGRGIVTEGGNLAAKFAVETSKATKKRFVNIEVRPNNDIIPKMDITAEVTSRVVPVGKVQKSVIGVKGKVKQTPTGTRSVAISQVFPSKQRAVSVSTSNEIVGGEFPRMVVKTQDFAPKLKGGRLQPTTGRAGILRKDYEVTAPNFAGESVTVETFTFVEKGASARSINKAFRKEKFTQVPPRTNALTTGTETILKSGSKESIVAGEFLKAIEKGVRASVPKKSRSRTIAVVESRPQRRTFTSQSPQLIIVEPLAAIETPSRPIQDIIQRPSQITNFQQQEQPFINQITGQGQRQTPRRASSPRTRDITIPDLPQDIIQLPAQGQIPIQEIIQEQAVSPIQTPRSPSILKPPIPPRAPPKFAIGNIFSGVKGNLPNLFKSSSSSPKTKYNPSVVAGLFKIKGRQPKIITGLEIRPLKR